MVTLPTIISQINQSILALSAEERWQGARRLSGDFVTERWFAVTMVIVMAACGGLLLVVSIKKQKHEFKGHKDLFADYASKRDLAPAEIKILKSTATIAGLHHPEAVFTMASAFDRGAARLIEQDLKNNKDTEKNQKLKTTLVGLRTKLGFRKRSTEEGSQVKNKQVTSRQIPVGKEISIKPKGADSDAVGCSIVKNSDIEFAVRMPNPIHAEPGNTWSFVYDFGSSVWQFDANIVNSIDDILVFNHSEVIHFLSRRKFPRISVTKSAYIAQFPFEKTVPRKAHIQEDLDEQSEQEQMSADPGDTQWRPPEFSDAVVTEISGAGLKLETDTILKVGERILVIFDLGDNNSLGHGDEAVSFKVLEDVALVRNVANLEDGNSARKFSVGIELIAIEESDLNELVRITNSEAVRAEHYTDDADLQIEEKLVMQTIGSEQS